MDKTQFAKRILHLLIEAAKKKKSKKADPAAASKDLSDAAALLGAFVSFHGEYYGKGQAAMMDALDGMQSEIEAVAKQDKYVDAEVKKAQHAARIWGPLKQLRARLEKAFEQGGKMEESYKVLINMGTGSNLADIKLSRTEKEMTRDEKLTELDEQKKVFQEHVDALNQEIAAVSEKKREWTDKQVVVKSNIDALKAASLKGWMGAQPAPEPKKPEKKKKKEKKREELAAEEAPAAASALNSWFKMAEEGEFDSPDEAMSAIGDSVEELEAAGEALAEAMDDVMDSKHLTKANEAAEALVAIAMADETVEEEEAPEMEEAPADEAPGWLESLVPEQEPEMEMAPAPASLQDGISRASDVNTFPSEHDISGNNLSTVETESGTELHLKKDVRSRIDRKVEEQFKGAFNEGDRVAVDFDHYIASGRVKKYLGDRRYSVAMDDGRTIQVPSSNLFRNAKRLWR